MRCLKMTTLGTQRTLALDHARDPQNFFAAGLLANAPFPSILGETLFVDEVLRTSDIPWASYEATDYQGRMVLTTVATPGDTPGERATRSRRRIVQEPLGDVVEQL